MAAGNLTSKQKIIIGAAVLAVLSLLLLFFSYLECKKIGASDHLPGVLQAIGKQGKKAPKKKEDQSYAYRIKQLNKKIKAHNEDISKEPDLRLQMKKAEAEWSKLNQQLPQDKDFIQLQQRLFAKAQEYGVNMEGGMSWKNPVPFDKYTSRVDISLPSIKSKFHNLGHFLYFLHGPLKRFIVIQGFNIDSGFDDVVENNEQVIEHDISLELVTFVERKK